MILQPDPSANFASLKTPIFTNALCVQLASCLEGFIMGILLDEHGTVCRQVEAELPENSSVFTWDGLDDLPYGIYTLQLLQGSHEMNMRIVKRV
jgi:hypothetical protein